MNKLFFVSYFIVIIGTLYAMEDNQVHAKYPSHILKDTLPTSTLFEQWDQKQKLYASEEKRKFELDQKLARLIEGALAHTQVMLSHTRAMKTRRI